MALKIRSVSKDDYPFIFNSWLKSLSKSFTKNNLTDKNVYYQGQHRLIERLLQTSNCHVAVDGDDESIIVGYLIESVEQSVNVVHYIYVKKDFRNMGIAESLLRHANIGRGNNIMFTHATVSGFALAQGYGAFYNPYLLIGGLYG